MLHLVLLCHSAGDGRRPRNHVQGCGSLESYNREACSTASGKRAPQVPNTKCLYTNMEAENIQIYNADMFFFFFFNVWDLLLLHLFLFTVPDRSF